MDSPNEPAASNEAAEEKRPESPAERRQRQEKSLQPAPTIHDRKKKARGA
jgi:hypothetical protein